MSSFKGSKRQEVELQDVISLYKGKQGGLMAVLQSAQGIYGYLPVEVQTMIAEEMDIPMAEIYGIVTFYSQFSLEPKGEHQISVCLGTACYVKGADKIVAGIEERLKIRNGECTKDGVFSLDATRCIGACGLAPVMMVDEDVYGKVTVDQLDGILAKYIKVKKK